MIPKVIHYCWFGHNPIPEKMRKCIESWKKYCPDYSIVCWNEENFDINMNSYVKTAYKNQKWAFVTDYARLWVIYNFGGFYLDTDVELLKPLDELRFHDVFFACEGKEFISTGLGFGAVANCQIIRDNMKVYEEMLFQSEEEFLNIKPCPYYTTKLLKDRGVQFPIRSVLKLENLVIYPNEYFNPYDWAGDRLKITKNTYSIHHYASSWMTKKEKQGVIEQHYYNIYKRKFGKRIADIWSYLYWNKKENGGEGIIKVLMRRMLKGKG